MKGKGKLCLWDIRCTIPKTQGPWRKRFTWRFASQGSGESRSSVRPVRPRRPRALRLKRTGTILSRFLLRRRDKRQRNLLRRAGRELAVERGGSWGEDHAALVAALPERAPACTRPPAHLQKTSPLFDRVIEQLACLRSSGRWTIGRFLCRGVRRPGHGLLHVFLQGSQDSPAGATDLLLSQLLKEASERGHMGMNLGLVGERRDQLFQAQVGGRAFPSLRAGDVGDSLTGNFYGPGRPLQTQILKRSSQWGKLVCVSASLSSRPKGEILISCDQRKISLLLLSGSK